MNDKLLHIMDRAPAATIDFDVNYLEIGKQFVLYISACIHIHYDLLPRVSSAERLTVCLSVCHVAV